MKAATILMVEDDPEVRDFLRELLETQGYACLECGSGHEALEVSQKSQVDLILLDKGLPDRDGLDLFEDFKKQPSTQNVPVIFITGAQEEELKEAAISMGAEDYIFKPFHTLDLVNKIESKLVDVDGNPASQILIKGELVIDVPRQKASVRIHGQAKEVPLNRLEFKLLAFLAQHEDKVYAREELLHSISTEGLDAGTQITPNTVDSHVSSLRKKIQPYSSYIELVLGSGYRFNLKN